jgi:tetratricopeptide (TPR) repeat protein
VTRSLLVLVLAPFVLAACADAPLPPPARAEPGAPPPCSEAATLAQQGDQLTKSDVDGAIDRYARATQLDPTNHGILSKLAAAYRRKEDWEKAAAALARATTLAPRHADYWFQRGYVLEQLARKNAVPWDACKDPFQRCIEADPSFAECYEELGNAFLWTDDEQRALESYHKAVEHDPSNIGYATMLAGLYLDLGYPVEAAQVLTEAKPFVRPDDKLQQRAVYNLHALLARAYQDGQSMPAAVAELEAAKAVAPLEGPESVLILWNLGSAYAALAPPRKAEAIALLKGFVNRACKGAKAASYRSECEMSMALISKLGGALQ